MIVYILLYTGRGNTWGFVGVIHNSIALLSGYMLWEQAAAEPLGMRYVTVYMYICERQHRPHS